MVKFRKIRKLNLQIPFSYVIILLTIPYLKVEISKLSVTSRKFDPRVIETLRKVTKPCIVQEIPIKYLLFSTYQKRYDDYIF